MTDSFEKNGRCELNLRIFEPTTFTKKRRLNSGVNCNK